MSGKVFSTLVEAADGCEMVILSDQPLSAETLADLRGLTKKQIISYAKAHGLCAARRKDIEE